MREENGVVNGLEVLSVADFARLYRVTVFSSVVHVLFSTNAPVVTIEGSKLE